ncbi:MAG: hypothetical protein RLZZ262_2392 [Bacteroidota bacterium]|jgi:hypothetical protein
MRTVTHNLLIVALIALSSCRREEPTVWNPSAKAAIAHGSLGLTEVLPSAYFYADNNDIWHFYLEQNLTDFNIDSLVEIPDTTIHRSIALDFKGGPFQIAAGTELYSFSQNNILRSQGALLKEAILRGGTLHYTFVSYVNGDLTCTCTLPGVTLNGNPVVMEAGVGATTNDFQPSYATGSIDLSNYHVDLTGTNGTGQNQFISQFAIRVAENASAPAIVYGDDSVTVALSFTDASVKYGRGYFGQHEYSFNETIAFGQNVQLPEGELLLDEATLALSIANYVGVDFQMKLNELSGVKNEINMPLEYSPLYDWQYFTRAQDNAGFVTPTTHNYLLLAGNSNLTNFIGLLPDQLHLAGEMNINSLGNIGLNNDFIYTDRTIEAKAKLDIPLQLATESIAFTDTITLTNTAIDLIANGEIKLVMDNYIPCDVRLTATLEDEDFVFDLVAGDVLEAATGPLSPTKTIIPITITPALLERAKNGAQIILQIELATENYPNFQTLTSQQRVDYLLVGEGDIQLEYE